MSWNRGNLPIHDHFDGSSNCIQCNGPCQLEGTDLFLTNVVRQMVEAWDLHGQHPAYMVQMEFDKHHVHLREALNACRSVNSDRGPRIKQRKD